MIDAVRLLPVVSAGVVCGAGFFGGLWWTVQHGLRSNHPALWFSGSTLIRTGGVIAVFVWIAHSDLQRTLACVAGFFLARVAAQILGRAPRPAPPRVPLLARISR